ncbi:MAG: SPFH domain-containing protein [Lachnospiraceae bacterium]|nr:SPFH domain-containing protein [Lachnospiraceae bacterium]
MAMLDVITYEGNHDVLVYRYPHTEFNTMSQLIVHESQEAVFFKNGQMLDSFGPGKYTLRTENIPLLGKLINLPTGGESPFRCEVYFINKTLALNYKWGTTSRTRVMDNQFHLLLEIAANGTIGLKVTNPRMLLSRIVGTEMELTAERCLEYFRENVSAKVKEYLASVMRRPEMNFLLLEMYLNDFSAAVKEMLREIFNDVGVDIYNFVIGMINIPEEQYAVITEGQRALQKAQYAKQLKRIEAEGDAESSVIRAGGRAKSRETEGYNWADEQVSEITRMYAANPGNVQNPVGMLAQAPMALAFGTMLKNGMEPAMDRQFSNAPRAFSEEKPMSTPLADVGTEHSEKNVNSGRAENNVPEKDAAYEDPVMVLTKLKKLLDAGLIPQDAYDRKMQEILDRM